MGKTLDKYGVLRYNNLVCLYHGVALGGAFVPRDSRQKGNRIPAEHSAYDKTPKMITKGLV